MIQRESFPVTLAFPPQGHFTQPYLALPCLKAWLEAKGFEDVELRDRMPSVHGRLIDVVDAVFNNRSGDLITRHYVLVDFVARWRAGEPVAGDDAAEARFFHQSELDSLELWSETRRIIQNGIDLLRE